MFDYSTVQISCPLCKFSLTISVEEVANEETIICKSCNGVIHLKDIGNNAKQIFNNINKDSTNRPTGRVTISAITVSLNRNKSELPNNSVLNGAIVGEICPYCGIKLNPIPQRKKKCPSCSKFIYVKRRLNEEVRRLVTEDDAKFIEQEWVSRSNAQELERILKEHNVDQDEQEAIHTQLGLAASVNDIHWAILNRRNIEAMRSSNWSQSAGLYFEMALICHEEGKAFFHLLQEHSRCQLRSCQQLGIENVEILTTGNQSCPRCRSLQGKVFNIGQALLEMPIPVRDCEYWDGWCRCEYLPCVD
jgi:ssDNA-binding Zn-finger/Zn-ribbon topoisomerase 1